MESTRLVVHTVPSTFVRENLPPTALPYKRVVALEVGGRVVEVADGQGKGENPSATTYDLPNVLAERLVHFAEWRFSPADSANARNCFVFGIYMATGILPPTVEEACKIIQEGARHTAPVSIEDGKVGDLSVIRAVPDFPREPVLHAQVRLSGEEYMQVMTYGGALGITDLEQPLAYRQGQGYREMAVRGLFGLDPTAWKVGHFAVGESLKTVL